MLRRSGLTLWATRAQRFQLLAFRACCSTAAARSLQLMLGLAQMGALGLLLGPLLAGLATSVLLARPAPQAAGAACCAAAPACAIWRHRHRAFPLLNTPHAFAGALQDSLAMVLIATWSGNAAAGYWALALRYLKAPAGLVGGALSQTLYPRLVRASGGAEALQLGASVDGRAGSAGLPLMLVLMLWGPWLFTAVFGERWTDAGELARALAPYVAMHFIAAPLSVATMAWGAQGWALKLALVGPGDVRRRPGPADSGWAA